jgi:predicted metal-dependent phosphoesterase TrpH
MRADLHVHSNASDGTDPPAEVIRNAAKAGLNAVALTDHDTTAGHAAAWTALPIGLLLIPGMELSCELAGRSVHLLGYLFDPDHEELAAETARIRDDRVIRAQAMVTKLTELGAALTWEQVAQIAGTSVVGRPHIARAMAEAGIVADPAAAFTSDWIADDGRAYVPKYALDPSRAIQLINAAGGVAVLAHPRAGRAWNLSDEEIAGPRASLG